MIIWFKIYFVESVVFSHLMQCFRVWYQTDCGFQKTSVRRGRESSVVNVMRQLKILYLIVKDLSLQSTTKGSELAFLLRNFLSLIKRANSNLFSSTHVSTWRILSIRIHFIQVFLKWLRKIRDFCVCDYPLFCHCRKVRSAHVSIHYCCVSLPRVPAISPLFLSLPSFE